MKGKGLGAFVTRNGSGFGWDRIYRGKRRTLRLSEERRNEAAGSREGEPQSRDRAIAGDVNQVGAEGGREAAKDRGCQAVGERKAGGSHFHGHDFGKEHNHGAVVAAVDEGKPEFDGEQAGERRIAIQPQHGGVGGEKHQESAAEEKWTATDSVGERAHMGSQKRLEAPTQRVTMRLSALER